MEQEFKKLYEYLEANMATKTDLMEMRDNVMSVMATKYDVQEVKDMVDRLSIRIDEDLRAVMKDVALLKSR